MRVELPDHPEPSCGTFASFSPSSVFTALSAAMSDCHTAETERGRGVNKGEGSRINERRRCPPHGGL